MINTEQHWQKILIFAPIKPFGGPTEPPHNGGNFEKFSDNLVEVWFIPLGHLLVLSWLDSPSTKKKRFKNQFFWGNFLYIYIGKSFYPSMFFTTLLLKNSYKAFYMYPEYIVRKPQWRNLMKNKVSRYSGACIWPITIAFKD